MLLLILGLFLFVLLVVLHEFGHFIAARRGGVEVEEFGVGFPPKLFGKHFGNHPTLYSVNLLPLGGFVRLRGEHDQSEGPGSFGAAPLSVKVRIMLAGVAMNLAIAWVLLAVLSLVGMPKLPLPNNEQTFAVASDSHIVSNDLYASFVEKDSPASKTGLKTEDKLISINGVALKTEAQLRSATKSLAGQTVPIVYKHAGAEKTATVTLRTAKEVDASQSTDNPKGYLGVVPYEYSVVRSTWSAPIVASGLIAQYSRLTVKGIGSALASLFKGHAKEASQNVSGPVGIFVVLKDGSVLGARYILLIIALLSLTLAVMNVLPIPALDGGRLFFTLVFRALKKPLTPKIEERIHGTGFALLMLLFVLITVVDVRRFF